MTWYFAGGGFVGPDTERVELGTVEGPLTEGHLPMRFRFSGANDWRPLSFGILEPIATDDTIGLPAGRVYPATHDVHVNLGPGVGGQFKGKLRYRPRNYNRMWLRYSQPVAVYSFMVWVWLPVGVTDPVAEFRLFVDEQGERFRPGPERIGPLGAAPLTRDG